MEMHPIAKINVALKITGLRDDGYHLIKTVILPLAICDTLSIEIIDGDEDILEINDLSLGNVSTNLVTRALRLFCKEFGLSTHFKVRLEKRIPVEAGLGGGSSDAACALKMASILCNVDDPHWLHSLAIRLGADVPYFFNARPSLVEGIGEKQQILSGIPSYSVLLAKPAKGLSTKEVYQASNHFLRKNIQIPKVIEALKNSDIFLLNECCGNDLEEPAISLLPEVKTLINIMKGLGFTYVQMTGSGTSVFAIDEDKERLEAGRKKLREDGYMAFLTSTLE